METFESVISRMPEGGEVRYFQYRHPAVKLDLENFPEACDKTWDAFIDLAVLIEEPLALDNEGCVIHNSDAQIIVGVVDYFSRDFKAWLNDHDASIVKSWRFLCEPA